MAEVLSWHWVFLGVVGLVVPALVMIVPVLRGMDRQPEQATLPPWAVGRIAWAALAALAVLGLNLSADVTIAGVPAAPALLAAAAVVIALVAVRPLVPRGTLLARRGLPSVILTRGLAAAAFFGAEVYLPYLLIDQYAFAPTFAGLALTAGAVAWAGAAAIQGRLGTRLQHRAAVRIGSALVLAAIVLTLATAALHWPAAVAIAGWTFAGGGMGLLYPRLSVMTLALSTKENEGFNSSAMSIADSLGGALALATTGIVFAAFTTTAESFAGVFALAAVVAVAAVAVAPRVGGQPGRRGRLSNQASRVARSTVSAMTASSPSGPVGDPLPRGADLHLPAGRLDAQFLHELGRGIEHFRGGVVSPRRQAVGVVAHDQQRSARLDRGSRRPQRGLPDQLGSVQELGRHQIVGLRGLPLVQVALFPVDAAGDGVRSRVHTFAVQGIFFVPGGAFQRDGGNIDGGDGPALLREPDGVGTFAATQVQCFARTQPGALADQLGVGFAAPDLRLAAVFLVPGFSRTLLPLALLAGAAVVRSVVVALALLRHASSLPRPGFEGNGPGPARRHPN